MANREYGEAPTLESVISAYGEAISMSEEDPVPGYEATKKASEKQLRRLLTNEEPIDPLHYRSTSSGAS